jgi:hypothetical protein
MPAPVAEHVAVSPRGSRSVASRQPRSSSLIAGARISDCCCRSTLGKLLKESGTTAADGERAAQTSGEMLQSPTSPRVMS